MQPIRTILAAHDFSERGEAALDAAVDLARSLGAALHLVHVVRPPAFDYIPGEHMGVPLSALHQHQDAERELNRIVRALPALPQPVSSHVTEGSNVSATLDEYAAEIGADMIVMGTHGYGPLKHLLIGSVAERGVRTASCPVVTVRHPQHPLPLAE